MSFSDVVRSSAIRRYLAIVLALAGLLLLPGCWVTSINPLYEEGLASKDPDVVFDASLIGSWIAIGDKCAAPLTITATKDGYDLQSTRTSEDEGCKDDKPWHYQGRLVKLDSHYFLDVAPMADAVCDMCFAKHNIFLAKLDKTTLSITPIDSDWLKKSIAAKTVTLATLGDDIDTITASSKELKAFCRRFAANKMVFKPESTTTFQRK
jgi:hypothetical protein